jgi:RNA polymerase sigma-70 factor (ECF subfamily)
MREPDAELAARSAAGDVLALEALYRRHVETVWRFAWYRTHSREAAAEVVQETFLRVRRAGATFKGRSAFATWLLAICRRVAVERDRQERRHHRRRAEEGILKLLPASRSAEPADRHEREQQREAVRAAVMRLPGPQRDAIALCELSGYRIKEAAEVLGWSEGRVKTTLFRARRRLRDMLNPDWQRRCGGRKASGATE